MAKRESTFTNMVTALLAVTLIASASLGYVYELTREPIAMAVRAKKNNAINSVVPDFDNNPVEEQYVLEAGGGELVFYPATRDGELVGTAVETFTNKGFSGQIRLMAGFLPDGTIYGIEVLEHRETPGLGDKIETGKSTFSLQFEGENPGEDFKIAIRQDGGDVDAITATTISSRAYCDAVRLAWETFRNQGGEISHELPSREESIDNVLPGHGNVPAMEEYQVVYKGRVYNLYPGRKGRNFTGTAVESYTESGYQSGIRIMAGFNNQGIITGIEVLEHYEPGVNSELIENSRSEFHKQFVNRDPSREDLRIKEDGGIIDAIAGATITSRAYCDALQIAYEVFKQGGKK
jgi:Na+-translocating ferredoxin:NAD+ oxidoreductase subunit G